MIPISQLVRMPKGTTETYLLDPGDESYFLKKLSTYATRTKAKIEHDVYICVRVKDDSVRRMVVCMVIRSGAKLRRERKPKDTMKVVKVITPKKRGRPPHGKKSKG